MKTITLICAALAVLGCSTGSAWVRDPRTGEVVECGAYFIPPHMWETAGYAPLKDCVQDYQRQGWERTTEPTR